MILRLRASGGLVDAIRGEAPSGLLDACRELVAQEPQSRGEILLEAVPGGSPRAVFRGRFTHELQQKVRNLVGLIAAGRGVPTRLDGDVVAFEVSVGRGSADAAAGVPPDVITKFCEAFARANPTAVGRVKGVLRGGTIRLQFQGDVPELTQKKLLRRWKQHVAGVKAKQ